MHSATIDSEQMQEYLETKKALEQYYKLRILLDMVRRPDPKQLAEKALRHRHELRPLGARRHKISW